MMLCPEGDDAVTIATASILLLSPCVDSKTASERGPDFASELSQPQAPSNSFPAMILVLVAQYGDTHIPGSKWREDSNESQGFCQSSLKEDSGELLKHLQLPIGWTTATSHS